MRDAELTATLVAQGWKPRDLPGFMGLAGPLWTLREPDGWAYGWQVEARHLNPAGVVHGGALATLMDHTLSTVAWEASGRTPCVTVQLDTHYLAPVAPGAFVQACGVVAARTGGLLFMDGHLQVDGSRVLVARAVMKALRATSGPAA